jgi:type 1 glutamine amidotransferase
MKSVSKLSRRSVIKSGISAAAGVAVSSNAMAAAPKQPGETRVLFLMGDFHHNPVMQEVGWRRVLSPTGWRLMFAQSSQFVTPEALDLADLFVVARYGGPDTLGWAPDRIIEARPERAPWMTDEQQDAIVANVNSGMGLLSVHCSIWNGNRAKYLDLIGVSKPIMHTKVQPAFVNSLNQDHPITQGIEPFATGDDEIFNAELVPGASTLLFKTRGEEEVINANGGWCRDAGEGRAVSLLPGHLPGPYGQRPYHHIMWRAAHWAMKRDIPAADHLVNSD